MPSLLGVHINLWKKLQGSVPECVWEQVNAETLVLADDQLTEVSSRIGRLKKLRLSSLPPSIAELSEVRQIDLRGNPITRLPEEMAGMTRLEKIDLRWVESLEWPKWFETLEARGCLVYR